MRVPRYSEPIKLAAMKALQKYHWSANLSSNSVGKWSPLGGALVSEAKRLGGGELPAGAAATRAQSDEREKNCMLEEFVLERGKD